MPITSSKNKARAPAVTCFIKRKQTIVHGSFQIIIIFINTILMQCKFITMLPLHPSAVGHGPYQHETGACVRSDYIEGVDWEYHAKKGSTAMGCTVACDNEIDCTGFEFTNYSDYCVLYFYGACSRSFRGSWYPISGKTTYFTRDLSQPPPLLDVSRRHEHSSRLDITRLGQRLGMHGGSNCTDSYAMRRIGSPRPCEYTCEHLRSVLNALDAACVISNASTVSVIPPLDNERASLWDDTGTRRPISAPTQDKQSLFCSRRASAAPRSARKILCAGSLSQNSFCYLCQIGRASLASRVPTCLPCSDAPEVRSHLRIVRADRPTRGVEFVEECCTVSQRRIR